MKGSTNHCCLAFYPRSCITHFSTAIIINSRTFNHCIDMIPVLEGIFIIAMTGMADDPEDLRRLKGRADVIMPKPIDEDHLLELIRAAFKTDTSGSLRRHVQNQ